VIDVFVDTSAFIALLVADDAKHKQASKAFEKLAADDVALGSSSYVLVETYALLQRRIGLQAVETMRHHLAPLVEIVWVNAMVHEAALDRLSLVGRKKLSLVDCVSFEIMEQQGITKAFAFDKHFVAEGFPTI